jgi:hypothetical protein
MTALPVQGGAGSPVDWSSASDMQVMLQAVEMMPTMPADSTPRYGTFYSAQHAPGTRSAWPPLPGNPNNLPVWNLGDGVYLLADQQWNYSLPPLSSSMAGGGMMAADGMGPPGSGGTNIAYGADNLMPPDYGTNLWLGISSVANGVVSLSLSNTVYTQTGEVYEVMSKTDLSIPGWNIETEVWAVSNQNWIALTVPMSSPTNLFFWARDWTGVTENGNTTPDWWFYYYFGTTALSDTNLDSQGNTLLSDYQSGTDPNIIQFSIEVADNYVNTSYPSLQLNVTAGVPSCCAVLVDSTNFAGANWTAYTSSTVMANLGSLQGWHDIWIGLRGLPSNATQTWQWKRLKLDFTPPLLVITNPTVSTVSVPLIQVQGYSPEPLDSISYDLTNALGLVTNQDAGITSQYYDTNTWDFTTNYFECVDVPLTNGVNTITLHATDLAGNVTTASISFTVDYSTATNPLINLTWPQDGMQLCGDNFALRGWVDDPTASVSASITDTNGDTSIVSGEVERTGVLWTENLPLAEGTNTVTLNVTNAAGYSSETNITVVKSDMTLTLTNIDGDLWQPTVNVSGNISDPSYAVWVNGVQGTNNGDGTWSAANVPVSSGGVASFDVSAVNGGDPAISVNTNKPATLYFQGYTEWRTALLQAYESQGTEQWYSQENHHWMSGNGAGGSGSADIIYTGWDTGNCVQTITWTGIWPASSWPDVVGGFQEVVFLPDGDDWPYTNTPDLESEHCDVVEPVGNDNWEDMWMGYPESLNCSVPPGNYGGGCAGSFSRHAQGTWHLQTGGKALVQRQNLFQLTATATEVLNKLALPMYDGGMVYYGDGDANPNGHGYDSATQVIPPQNITMDGKPVGSDGNQWRMYADNDDHDVTPRVKNNDFYTFNVSTQKYTLTILASSSTTNTDLSTAAPEFCVGQQVTLSPTWSPDVPPFTSTDNVWWHLPQEFVNQEINYSATCTNYVLNNDLLTNSVQQCWYMNGSGGACSTRETYHFANGQSASIAAAGYFTIYRPSLSDFTNISPTSTNSFIWLAGNTLSYGDPVASVGGMDWKARINSKYDGRMGVSQIFKAHFWVSPSLLPDPINTLSSPAADAGEFYDVGDAGYAPDGTQDYHASYTNYPALQQVELEDYPDLTYPPLAWWGEIQFADSADYIRFKQGLGSGDGNIYVTLGVVHWQADGEYELSTFIPLFETNSTPAASAPDSSDDFPIWNSIRQTKGN